MRILSGLVFIFASHTAFAAEALPEPLGLLTSQGGEVVSQFDAPSGMKGYVAEFRGQVLTLYVTPDGKYMFTGAMVDADGQDIAAQYVEAYKKGPKSEKDWTMLQSTHWIADGSPDAKTIIYTFTDPNCPYCRKLWQKARPWVDAGQVQLRHILVGILRADSPGKAAAILGAEDPAATLYQHEAGQLPGGLQPLDAISDKLQQQLQDNQQAMMTMGVSATPAIMYRDENGAVVTQMGVPSGPLMDKVFGKLDD